MRAFRDVLKRVVQLVVGLFYRRVDVVTSHPLSADGPSILAVNHTNGLGDSFVIIAKTPGFPRFLAAASWWKFAPARFLFALGGVLPVHRRRAGEDTQFNVEAFQACYDALAQGAQIAIHPEGDMHQELSLLPLRTGAARIALGAGLRDLTIVPHAIVYADRGRFRSEAAINVGEPIEIDKWSALFDTEPEAAVRGLTDRITEGMRAVTTNYASAREAEVVERAAAYALAEERDAGYGRRHALCRQLIEAIRAVGGASSTEFRALERAVADHSDALAALGLTRPGVAPALEPASPEDQRRNAAELAALTPIAAAGMLTSGAIVLAVSTASRFVRGEGWQATIKAIVGFLGCPVFWGAEALLLGRARGRRAAGAVALLAPVGAVAWIGWSARWSRARHELWRRRAAQTSGFAVAEATRADVRRQVGALVRDRVS